MPRASQTFSEMFLPRGTSRPKRSGAIDDNPAVQAIWDVVCAIPSGQVSTYGAVARAAGLPGRARLAGRALKLAPEGMNLPWHRVVGACGKIVFAKSSSQHKEQARRLRGEGVAVKQGRISRDCIAVNT